jgi:hypothetical protein
MRYFLIGMGNDPFNGFRPFVIIPFKHVAVPVFVGIGKMQSGVFKLEVVAVIGQVEIARKTRDAVGIGRIGINIGSVVVKFYAG